ncbi:MAG: cell division protein FtsZ [Chloroflexi bacterium]|nr:cell division protein FtsZ [Chloroflexota bacterium]
MSKTSYVPSPAKIKVIGMGGAGCNAITRMVREQIRGVEFIAMNTDVAHLEITEAPVRIALGEKLTRGLGAGGDHNVGRRSAEETRDEIKQSISGADMIFLAAGMGGGTGTGSIAVVAEMAKQTEMADEILCHAVQSIAEVITVPGLVNLDFADIRAIMKDAGPAWMSMGRGSGQNRAVNAAKEALASPMLDVSVVGAKGVLFNVAGGSSLTLFEVSDAAKVIGEAVDPEANIIFGVNVDPNMGNEVRLTLIATGFASRDQISGAARDKEIMKTLKSLKSEDDLSVPAYMRYRGTYRR